MPNTTAENGSVNITGEWIGKIGVAESIIGMVLNTLAWLVILRTKTLHNMTNYLLAYLAVVDSLTCFCPLFLFATANMVPESVIVKDIYCRLIKGQFLQLITFYTSGYGLCVVTYERYIGIVHPLHYPRLLSAKKVSVIIFITWMIGCLLSSPFLFKAVASKDAQHACTNTSSKKILVATGYSMAVIFIYLLPITFMSWAYYEIQATLKISAQQLRQQNVQAAAYELLQARQKVVNMLMIVMGALFVLWTPRVIVLIFDMAYVRVDKTLYITTELVYYMNYVINPIIYIFKYKKFRIGLKDMLCCCFMGQPVRPNQIAME